MADCKETQALFSAWDYVVFAALLSLSALIGVYHACTGGKQRTTREFLLANKNMAILPAMLSLLASFLSSTSVLGQPTELYYYGTMFAMFIFAGLISYPLTAIVYIPVFYNLELTSVYEYLEMRFNKPVRMMGTIIFTLQMVLYMAVILYAPALAFSQVTGFQLWISILSTGAVCTFYTSIGGMKAVMWADTIQTFVTLAGVLAIIVKGFIDAGGFMEVWRLAEDGGRIDFLNFDPNPTERYTWWSVVLGGTFAHLCVNAINQASVQRYFSVSTVKKAQWTIYIMWPFWLLFTFLFLMCGLVIYAKYEDCDPLLAGCIQKPDQIVPYFVMEELGHLKGLPGLFVAACFGAALSTVSSGVNSIAAVLLVDLIKPWYQRKYGEDMEELKATRISKLLALTFGILVVGLAFASEVMGDTIVQITLSIFGWTGGPLLGVFTMGLLLPWANEWGAVFGLIGSLIFSLWLGIGTILSGYSFQKLPISDEGCAEIIASALELTNKTDDSDVFPMYKVSHMWYATYSTIVCMVIGMTVSFLTGGVKKQLDRRLFFEPVTKLQCFKHLETQKWVSSSQEKTKNGNVSSGESYRKLDWLELSGDKF